MYVVLKSFVFFFLQDLSSGRLSSVDRISGQHFRRKKEDEETVGNDQEGFPRFQRRRGDF